MSSVANDDDADMEGLTKTARYGNLFSAVTSDRAATFSAYKGLYLTLLLQQLDACRLSQQALHILLSLSLLRH